VVDDAAIARPRVGLSSRKFRQRLVGPQLLAMIGQVSDDLRRLGGGLVTVRIEGPRGVVPCTDVREVSVDELRASEGVGETSWFKREGAVV